MIIPLALVLWSLPVLLLYSDPGGIRIAERNRTVTRQSGQIDIFSELNERDDETKEEKRSFSPYHVLSSMQRAYPDKISLIYKHDGDWAVLVQGKLFYWAHGRLLPSELRDRWEDYDPYPFYSYTLEMPPLPVLTEEEKEEISVRQQRWEADPVSRHPGFYETLWRIYGRESGTDRTKTIFFLGLKADIHQELLEEVAQVEDEIREGMKTDPELRSFVEGLTSLAGYNYRRIAGTSTLSFHSLGVAIDVIPRYYGGKQVYWRWAKKHFDEWYSIPYSSRFTPPPSFIRAFENNGFIWGGKWFYFDTIHFEYRPEILIMNQIPYAPQVRFRPNE